MRGGAADDIPSTMEVEEAPVRICIIRHDPLGGNAARIDGGCGRSF
jgi:hypothetical protein